MATISTALAQFMRGLKFEQIPDGVIEKCKLHILDILGIALASSRFDFGRAVREAVRNLGRGSACTAIGFGEKLPATSAALLNGSLAHSLDFDDTHVASIIHCGASVIPAALAVAEETKAGGKTALTAMVAGFEVLTRLGLAAQGKFHDRGFHPTSICGALSASLVAGRIYGSSLEQLEWGLGISGTMSSGLLEIEDSWLKRLHPGWAGHAGISAALLAKSGFVGPKTILEGRSGLYASHLYGDSYDLDALTRGLGRDWETLNIGFKPYPCCHFTHAFIDSARLLAGQQQIDPADIEEVLCLVSPRLVPIICEPREMKCRPPTAYAAMFSIPFTVAAMLATRRVNTETFTARKIRDARILALAERVIWKEDPESDYPRNFPGYVRITLKDGKAFEWRERVNRGGPENPMSKKEIQEKFLGNAGKVLPREKCERVMQAVDALEELPVSSLMKELRIRTKPNMTAKAVKHKS